MSKHKDHKPEKSDPVEFFRMAIPAFRKALKAAGKGINENTGKEYRGIHTVYAKLNGSNISEVFRNYYGTYEQETYKAKDKKTGEMTEKKRYIEPAKTIKKLCEEEKLFQHFAYGGAILYLPEDKPEGAELKDATKAIENIGLK